MRGRLKEWMPLACGLALGIAAAGNARRADAIAGAEFVAGQPQYVIDVNDVIGAGAYYDLGFFGSRAIVANIEAGAIWNGHVALQTFGPISVGRVSQFIADPAIVASGTTELGETDFHATMVGHVIGGQGRGTASGQLSLAEMGIALNAQLWSGSIATEFLPNGAFQITDESFMYAYATALRTGIASGTQTLRAKIANSSWGYGDSTASNPRTITLDALARENNVVNVIAAGNEGPGGDTVGGPASGYNSISVGALTTGSVAPYYAAVADFSSRAPSDFYNPVTLQTIPGARPTVDIAAPGDKLFLAAYLGDSGGYPGPYSSDDNLYFLEVPGTSFAAPMVAGGAALMVDVGEFFVDAGVVTADIVDARVIKAVLLASAEKPVGWTNGQRGVGGVITTTQALDSASGAGMLDLEMAYRIHIGDPTVVQVGEQNVLVAGVNSSLGVSGTGLALRGWDLGTVLNDTDAPAGNVVTYGLGTTLFGGFNELTAAVTWFADRTVGETVASAQDRALGDLSLQVWRTDLETPALIAQSIAAYSTTEFLRFHIPQTGSYELRVLGLDPVYNSTGEPLFTDYAIAWAVVPEPATWAMLVAGGLVLAVPACRRRSHQRASTAMPPRSPIGSGTTVSSMPAKRACVRSTARALAQARYQPRNTCDG